MSSTTPILIGKGAVPQQLDLAYANRHGLVAGASGTSTGKTITLQVLAMAKSVARSVGSGIGRSILRGVLGSLAK